MPTSVRLPEEAEKRLNALAAATGRTKAFYIKKAILGQLDEMEEVFGYMEEAARARDFIEYARYHVYLHEIFISASKNDMLIALLHNVRMHTLGIAIPINMNAL